MKTISVNLCNYFLKIFPIAKDMNKIIKSFLYEKCDICNNFHNTYHKINYENKSICSFCFLIQVYKECGKCEKYFLEKDTIYCNLCRSQCLVYCPNCFNLDEF
jgi:hypothetical protein